MRQILCDKCTEPIGRHWDKALSPDENREREMVTVEVKIGSYDDEIRGQIREYHRACARELTVAEVYVQRGLMPF